jgi:hypothetical protein
LLEGGADIDAAGGMGQDTLAGGGGDVLAGDMAVTIRQETRIYSTGARVTHPYGARAGTARYSGRG